VSTPTFPIEINKTVTNIEATSGVFTLTLSDVNGIQVGSRVDIGGLPTAAWNTPDETVTAVNATNKTIQYTHGNFTIASQEVWGQLHVETTWATIADVEDYLGFTAAGSDLDYLTICVDAANDKSWYWRAAAGYEDHPNVSPGSNAKLAVILLAGMFYRQKGSVDGFQSYQDMSINASVGNYGEVKKLLGVNRAQVG
jgi:hypothetical protein